MNQTPDTTAVQLPGAANICRKRLPMLTLVLGVLALVSGLAYFLYSGPTYQPDSPTYIVPAKNLLNGHGFVNAWGHPETVRTPGYPLFLAPFLWAGLDLKYLVFFQHLLRVLLILATSAFTFSLTGSSRRAILTGILLCIDLPLLAAANSVLTEMLFTVVLSLDLWLLWADRERRWIHLMISGLLCGASVLVRPITLFFFVPVAAYLLLAWKSARWRNIIIFVLAFSLLPFLWATRNYIQTGYFTVSTISGYNILAYRAAGVLAIEDRGNFSTNLERHSKELQEQACTELSTLYHQDCSQLPVPVVFDYYSRLGRRVLSQHRVAYIKLAARGAAAMMLGGEADSIMKMTGMRPARTKAMVLAYTVPALCFALAGFMGFWKENRQFFYLAFLVILYFVVTSAGGEAYSRFRVPITPMYILLVSSGIDLGWLKIFRDRNRPSPKEVAENAKTIRL